MSSEPEAAWFGQVVTGMPAVSRTPSTRCRERHPPLVGPGALERGGEPLRGPYTTVMSVS
jgi:hypothetical protein